MSLYDDRMKPKPKIKLVWTNNNAMPDVMTMTDAELEYHFRKHDAPCLVEERPISENDQKAISRWFGGDTQ
jgi:hypothetical protein